MRSTPTEEFINLRHRFGRVIEIELAYQVFNLNEIQFGEDKVLKNDIQSRQITHSLLVAFYSYLYSLFDRQKNAVSFLTIHKQIKNAYPTLTDLICIGDKVESEWTKIESEIQGMRHNVGFHFSKSFNSRTYGYDQFAKIHPLTPYIVLDGLRFYFRIAMKYFTFEEGYLNGNDETDVSEYLKYLDDKISTRNSVLFDQ